MEQLATFIGLIGVVMLLAAYGLLTRGVWRADAARYHLLNIGGTVCTLISVWYAWNLPAFISNLLWISIGIFSLVRIYCRKAA
ncbi:MAG: hypothetical protein ACKVOE_10790 [Rickettsiales bacterium]